MTPLAIAALALAMSADAFAAAVARGVVHRPTVGVAIRNGLVFGLIEAITPVIGWALGLAFADIVQEVDHWIAFVLLAAVGGRTVWEGLKPDHDDEDDRGARRSGAWVLVATAVGTSLDAAVVGVGLAFIGVNIWIVAAAIGVTTFVMTTLGMLIGRVIGQLFGRAVEVVGGLVLIGLGVAVLIDHLGLLR